MNNPIISPLVSSATAEEALGLQHKYLLGAETNSPLFLLVHGRAGNFDVMWAFRRCVPEGAHIFAPQGFLNDPVGGYSWWDIAASHDHKAGAEPAAQKLLNFIIQLKRHYNLQPRYIVGLGFSQGAGLLSTLMQIDPNLFIGVGLLAGFVVDLGAKTGKPHTKIFIGHGSDDKMVPIAKARQGEKLLRERDYQVSFCEDPVGHKIGPVAMRELKSWCRSL